MRRTIKITTTTVRNGNTTTTTVVEEVDGELSKEDEEELRELDRWAASLPTSFFSRIEWPWRRRT